MTLVVANESVLHGFLEGADGPVAKELLRAAIVAETTAKRITAGPGSGVTYIHHGIAHTASAPGEPFATDSGRLRASLTHSLDVDFGGLVAKVGSNVDYADDVELGTSRMAARPYLRPAVRSLSGAA